ncbi:MAG TPA: hypothetical protein VG838_16790 [Opitutaceae bacterium]|nr:hypothetical protein [Opitutaceae bacterium]
MENKEMMQRLSDKVGREKAIELVLQAYNTELITTWLSRLEPGKPLGGPKRHDHLGDALKRVVEVCDLTSSKLGS